MDDNHDTISRYYFESITTKLERTIEKLWILCVILIILLVGSNGAWLYYQSQFQDEVKTETTMIEAEQDGAGVNIVGGGSITYGTTSENKANSNN